jgi:hypothetical protein
MPKNPELLLEKIIRKIKENVVVKFGEKKFSLEDVSSMKKINLLDKYCQQQDIIKVFLPINDFKEKALILRKPENYDVQSLATRIRIQADKLAYEYLNKRNAGLIIG